MVSRLVDLKTRPLPDQFCTKKFLMERSQLFYFLNCKKSKASDNFRQVHVPESNKRMNVTHIDMSYKCVFVMSLRYKLCSRFTKVIPIWVRSGSGLGQVWVRSGSDQSSLDKSILKSLFLVREQDLCRFHRLLKPNRHIQGIRVD